MTAYTGSPPPASKTSVDQSATSYGTSPPPPTPFPGSYQAVNVPNNTAQNDLGPTSGAAGYAASPVIGSSKYPIPDPTVTTVPQPFFNSAPSGNATGYK